MQLTHPQENEMKIDMTPSWETAVMIYMMCLKNPNASADAHAQAERDLLRLARTVDEMNAKAKQEAA